MNPTDFGELLTLHIDFLTFLFVSEISRHWIAMKFGTNIPHSKNCNNFGDPLAPYLTPSGQVSLSNTFMYFYDLCPNTCKTPNFPSASAALYI